MRAALDVHRELLARAVPHEVVRLRSRASTADDLPALLGVTTGCIAVRCYRLDRDGREGFAAVLVHAGCLPDPAALLEAVDACSLRAASDDEVNAATDFAAALVSPVCLPEGVEVLADADLQQDEVSWCALGEAGVALGIRTADLLAAVGARVVPLSPRPVVPQSPAVLELDRPGGARTTF